MLWCDWSRREGEGTVVGGGLLLLVAQKRGGDWRDVRG